MGVALNQSKIWVKLVDTIEGTTLKLNTGVRKYFNDELEAKPLVPDLKTILNNLKDIDNVDLIMKSSIDELILNWEA